mgnify:CR=1 FL=1
MNHAMHDIKKMQISMFVTHAFLHVVFFLEADDYLNCLERGRAASSKMTEFARSSLESAQVRTPFMNEGQ